jgi:hypothetical protein
MKIVIALTALSLLAGPALADPPATASTDTNAVPTAASTAAAAPATPDPNKKICKTKTKTGSRFPERTCLTKAEWDYLAAQSSSMTSQIQVRAYQANGGGGGG